ncbi:MAG: dihydropteroate synthase [Acidobacteria bacterium]|nr:dihydropteroate synthase [Acidobacteriota bacterium]
MNRKRYIWKLKERELTLGDQTLIVGILNLTPDSFSDGGKYMETETAYARALELEELGADVIDIGAESTRPGSARITEEQELHRLIPVLKRLAGKMSIPISVDTYKAAVADRALGHGAEIINDPSALTFDPHLAKVVVKHDAGLILNHMRGTPETWAKLPPLKDPAGTVLTDLTACAHRAMLAGTKKAAIVLDPGLGFGKRREENTQLLARLSGIAAQLDFPFLVGPSRKQFLQQPTEMETSYAGAAAVAAAILYGAHMVRVHDVKEMAATARLADQILRGMPEGS